MITVGFSFGFDELPPEPGDKCRYCEQLIIEVKIVPFLQSGSAENTDYMLPMCKYCYQEKFGDVTTQ